MPADIVGMTPMGRREANKREKLTRIRQAAKEVFLSKGFEGATVREIAAAADVALGTLFLYGKDKQDLLLLIFEEDLPGIAANAFRKASADLPFVDQLVAFCSEFYAFFSATPALSRDMLREITFGSGTVATRIWAASLDIQRYVARLVARGQAKGDVSSSIVPDVAAHTIFSLHRVQIRLCLSQAQPDTQASIVSLRRQFEVLFSGLEARHAQGSTTARRRSAKNRKATQRS